MGKKRLSRADKKILPPLLWCCVLAVSMVSSTYAWFTANRQVSTGTVSAEVAEEDLKLLLCGTENGDFSETDAVIMQVNATSAGELLPVSTADLKNFSRLVSIDDEGNNRYGAVKDERDLFHGRIFIRPTAENMQTDGRMALYLDPRAEAGGNIVENVAGNLMAAGRLGLVFHTAQNESYIFYLSPPGTGEVPYVVAHDGQGGFAEVPDPAISLSNYELSVQGGEISLPTRPLAVLELNQTCMLDIYFYLEGCDPECIEEISRNSVDLHMAFYGVLTE